MLSAKRVSMRLQAVRMERVSLGDCVRVVSAEVKPPKGKSVHYNYMKVTEIWQDDKVTSPSLTGRSDVS